MELFHLFSPVFIIILTSLSIKSICIYFEALSSLNDNSRKVRHESIRGTNDNQYRNFWVPLTKEEKSDLLDHRCDSKFQHCCVGQCRSAEHTHPNFDELLMKWTQPTATFTDVLKNIEERKVNPEKSCNLLFIGDSLTSDTAMGAACELESAGYELTACISKFGANQYGKDSAIFCQNADVEVPHLSFKNDQAEFCKEVIVVYLRPTPYDEYKSKSLEQSESFKNAGYRVDLGMHQMIKNSKFENGFITIFNWGVHCNEPENSGLECMRETIENSFVPFVNDETFSHWTFLYSEHEPQHFQSEGGIYVDNGTENQSCIDTRGKANNWRNEEAAVILKDSNLIDKVPIIKIFDKIEPLSGGHCSQLNDCVHYAYNPYRLQVTWDALLDALKQSPISENSVS